LTQVADTGVALGTAAAEVPFDIENGSFLLHVTNAESGERTSHLVQVDPTTMSMDDLAAAINAAVGGAAASASVTVSGELKIDAAAGYELSFSEDSSGALAALGVNAFFGGSSGVDIQVSSALVGTPSMLGAGAGHVPGSNSTALALAMLQDTSIEALGGKTLLESWRSGVNDLAVRTSAANTRMQGSALVRESLHAQSQAVSGVSLDEEAIDLLSYQRQFQAAARFISVIDETLQSLLSIV
jgi:flagellar hook-associated protein 1 FlgK